MCQSFFWTPCKCLYVGPCCITHRHRGSDAGTSDKTSSDWYVRYANLVGHRHQPTLPIIKLSTSSHLIPSPANSQNWVKLFCQTWANWVSTASLHINPEISDIHIIALGAFHVTENVPWNNGKEDPRLDLTSSTTPGRQIHYGWPHLDSKYN